MGIWKNAGNNLYNWANKPAHHALGDTAVGFVKAPFVLAGDLIVGAAKVTGSVIAAPFKGVASAVQDSSSLNPLGIGRESTAKVSSPSSESVVENAKGVWSATKDAGKNIGGTIKNFFVGSSDTAGGAVKGALGFAKDTGKGLINTALGAIKSALNVAAKNPGLAVFALVAVLGVSAANWLKGKPEREFREAQTTELQMRDMQAESMLSTATPQELARLRQQTSADIGANNNPNGYVWGDNVGRGQGTPAVPSLNS